jgi:hypothetical protein
LISWLLLVAVVAAQTAVVVVELVDIEPAPGHLVAGLVPNRLQPQLLAQTIQ